MYTKWKREKSKLRWTSRMKKGKEEPPKWRTEVPVKIDELGSKKEARTGQLFFSNTKFLVLVTSQVHEAESCPKKREGKQAEEKGRKTEEKRMAK